MDLLFAYGTLRRGGPHAPPALADALRTAEHLGRAFVRARLHMLGGYPAIVRSEAEGDRVVGDVYRIEEALWPRLDSYEGGAYVREEMSVTLENGVVVRAFAYLCRDPQALGARIESGDFLA